MKFGITLNTLKRFNKEERSTRIELTLRHLFEQDDHNSNFEHQKELDLFSIHKLLPQYTEEEINECLEVVGDIPHRKAVTLRMLIWKHGKTSNRKREFVTDFGDEELNHKVPRIENPSSSSNLGMKPDVVPSVAVCEESSDSITSNCTGK